MTRAELERFAREWRVRVTAREALFVAAAVCAAAALAAFWLSAGALAVVALGLFAVSLAVRLAFARPWRLNAAHVARHLDREFPQLEESSALWLRPVESLTFIEQLQRRRADEAARSLSNAHARSFAAPPTHLLRQPFIWLAVALALLVAVSTWRVMNQPRAAADLSTTAAAPAKPSSDAGGAPQTEWPQIERAEMVVVPPAYTGRAERRVSGFTAELEEGALVTWSVTLDRPVKDAGLRFGAGGDDVVQLRAEGDRTLRAERRITESELYGLAAVMSDDAVWRPHELHSLKVIKDRAPAVKIMQPEAVRTIVAPSSSTQATVEVLVSDDYAVADAHLIATVAKGTGEAVKFREQKIVFDVNEPAEGPANARRLRKTFDLLALGLEPGDELYFHVEAADNREPSSNRARSETRFIILKGADAELSTPGTGVAGVNLIPQYFRSQRQIIIDTEKLIADQAALAESEFRSRANNLAIDQQLLRQRYGEFLGEEADHAAEPAEASAEQEHEEHSPDDGHDHGPAAAGGAPRTQQEIMEEYGHQHDSQDEATLFDRETKGTMRQALAAMWEAERFLRVAQPREALGPENRALEIIKALQQADRAYVQRVGFEAAPVDFAARRLRGDVEDVPERIVGDAAAAPDSRMEADVRELLRLAPWRRTAQPLTDVEIETLRRIEPALRNAASDNPGVSLGALEELRRLAAGEALLPSKQSTLEAALLRMLPAAERRPHRTGEASRLAESYFRNLESAR